MGEGLEGGKFEGGGISVGSAVETAVPEVQVETPVVETEPPEFTAEEFEAGMKGTEKPFVEETEGKIEPPPFTEEEFEAGMKGAEAPPEFAKKDLEEISPEKRAELEINRLQKEVEAAMNAKNFKEAETLNSEIKGWEGFAEKHLEISKINEELKTLEQFYLEAIDKRDDSLMEKITNDKNSLLDRRTISGLLAGQLLAHYKGEYNKESAIAREIKKETKIIELRNIYRQAILDLDKKHRETLGRGELEETKEISAQLDYLEGKLNNLRKMNDEELKKALGKMKNREKGEEGEPEKGLIMMEGKKIGVVVEYLKDGKAVIELTESDLEVDDVIEFKRRKMEKWLYRRNDFFKKIESMQIRRIESKDGVEYVKYEDAKAARVGEEVVIKIPTIQKGASVYKIEIEENF